MLRFLGRPGFWFFLAILGAVVFAVASYIQPVRSATPAIAAPVCTGYQPVAGDTLWDLAESRLGNPFRWTEIWAQNPQIHQPGRKYVDGVGRTIVLVYPSDCLAGLDTHVAAVPANPLPTPEPTSDFLKGLVLLGLGFLMGLLVFRLHVARVNRQ